MNNETATAVWEARGVSGGVYLASYARQAIRVLHRRGGAQPLPHTSRPKTQSAGALRDQYNVEVRALSDTTNVMFPGVSQQKVISGGMNSLNVTVNPTSYRHSYRLVSQTGGVQVTLTGAGHTFFDDTLNSSGLAFTDTLYAGASEQLQLQAQ
ncbi:MAG: hypothetical protein K9I47_11550, partial [Bacteroidales bacterium]|nr:hypothetical protein [Bacteroidales bacterium]